MRTARGVKLQSWSDSRGAVSQPHKCAAGQGGSRRHHRPPPGGGAESAAEAAEGGGAAARLDPAREVTSRRPHVFRLGSNPRIEAELLADYALRELGIRRFAILYPRDAYGTALRGSFWDAVEARGGSVVGVAAYDPDATDFAEPIRHIIGYEFLGAGEQGALATRKALLKRANRMPARQAAELRRQAAKLTGPRGEPLPPFVDFEALFIPDSHENAALIAPHLAFHEVRGVRLLGTSGWNHPDLLKIGGKHMNGAIFTADFYPRSSHPLVTEFLRRFRETFGAEPSSFSAQHSMPRICCWCSSPAGAGPEQVVKGYSPQRLSGVSGITSMRRETPQTSTCWGSRGEIVSIDETGEPPFCAFPRRSPRIPVRERWCDHQPGRPRAAATILPPLEERSARLKSRPGPSKRRG
jgi:hypothetical protein